MSYHSCHLKHVLKQSFKIKITPVISIDIIIKQLTLNTLNKTYSTTAQDTFYDVI